MGSIFLTLLAVDARYDILAAQTDTQTAQAPSKTQPAEASLPDGPGKAIVLRACVQCHALKVVTSKRASADNWATTVNNMVNRGAVLSDDEMDEVIDYLSRNFKPAPSDQTQQPDAVPQK